MSMKVSIKTLKGSAFQIQANPQDKVSDVKRNIETVQGAAVYPAAQQVLIHQGKVLKDDTTLEQNNVADNSFIVIMLSKNKAGPTGSTSSAAPSTTTQPPSSTPAPAQPAPAVTPAPSVAAAPAPSPAPTAGVYDQAASNLVAGSTLESTVQQLLDMGGGSWDRDTVVRALRAAFNNPERAVDYLYSGIPEQPEVVQPIAQPPAGVQPVIPQAAQPAVPSVGPNANPLNLFPQGLPNLGTNAAGAGPLEFLRNSPQFQTLRTMVQGNPQILPPLLQELQKQNPQLVRLIQEHQDEFLNLINEPGAEGEGDMLGEFAEAMPQTVAVTPEERDAIERLQGMGFDQALVLQVFFACNKNEELAANYLLDHMNEFED